MARNPSRSWFGDRYEIEHVVEVLRDAGDALRTPGLSQHLIAQITPVGMPRLRAMLEHALKPWFAANPLRPLNTFERPVYEALELIREASHAGDLDETDLRELERHLLDAHMARLEPDAMTAELARRAGGKARAQGASPVHKEIRSKAKTLLASGRTEKKDLAGILAARTWSDGKARTARQIRTILNRPTKRK